MKTTILPLLPLLLLSFSCYFSPTIDYKKTSPKCFDSYRKLKSVENEKLIIHIPSGYIFFGSIGGAALYSTIAGGINYAFYRKHLHNFNKMNCHFKEPNAP